MGEDTTRSLTAQRDGRTTAAVAAFEAIMVLARHNQLSHTRRGVYDRRTKESKEGVKRDCRRYVCSAICCRCLSRPAGRCGPVSIFGHLAYIICRSYSCTN